MSINTTNITNVLWNHPVPIPAGISLHDAAKVGDIITLKQLCQNKQLINVKNESGLTPLDLAFETLLSGVSSETEKKVTECIGELLKQGAIVATGSLETVLPTASLELLAILFKEASLPIKSHSRTLQYAKAALLNPSSDDNLLCDAIKSQDLALARVLIREFGMDLMEPSRSGTSPAALLQSIEDAALVAKFLALYQENHGKEIYCKIALGDLEGVKKLLASGSAVTFSPKRYHPVEIALLLGQSKIAEFLIEKTPAKDLDSVIDRLTQTKNIASLAFLASKNVRISSSQGSETFINALARIDKYPSQPLLSDALNLIEINRKRGVRGNTPLISATFFKHTLLIQTLLEKGANPCFFNDHDESAAHVALIQDQSAQLFKTIFMPMPSLAKQELPQKGFLAIAMSQKNEDLTKELLARHQLLLDACDSKGYTALYYAVKFKETEITTQLLSLGANPSARDLEKGKLPLVKAIQNNDKEATQLLLDHGAEVNIYPSNRFSWRTPLIAAIETAERTGDKALFDLIIATGADPHFANGVGMTPRLYCEQGLKPSFPDRAYFLTKLPPQDDYLEVYHAKISVDNILAEKQPYPYGAYLMNSTSYWPHLYLPESAISWSEFCKTHHLFEASSQRTLQALLRTEDSTAQVDAFFKTGEPCLCLSSWKGHAVSIGIYPTEDAAVSHFVIVNGGPRAPSTPPVQMYRFKSKQITKELLDEIKTKPTHYSERQGIGYFYNELPQQLQAQKLDTQIKCKAQSSPNCSYYCVQKLQFVSTYLLEKNVQIPELKSTYRIWHYSFKAKKSSQFKDLVQKRDAQNTKYFERTWEKLSQYRRKLSEGNFSEFLSTVDAQVEALTA